MKLGVHLVNFDLPGGPAAIPRTLARVGAAAEEAGIANLSAMDHYLQIAGMGVGLERPSVAALGFAAGPTPRRSPVVSRRSRRG